MSKITVDLITKNTDFWANIIFVTLHKPLYIMTTLLIKGEQSTEHVLLLSSTVTTQSTAVLAIYTAVQFPHLTAIMLNGHMPYHLRVL
jgi:hypothetical protein